MAGMLFNRLSAVGMLLALSGFVADAKAQNVLGEIVRRMDVHNKALQSLKANVTMVKHNPQLNTSDTTIGSVIYLPKSPRNKNMMYVRIDWTKPLEEQISVIGDNYTLFRPRLAQVITGKVKQAKNSASVGSALGFMSMRKDELNANYEVRYLGEEQISGGVMTWHLELKPKSRTSYKVAELWVDSDGMPRKAKIVEHNDDSTTVLLSNLQKNIRIDTRIFEIKYPKSIKPIQG